MNSSLDAVGGAETATERLQFELEQLRSELDSCSTRLREHRLKWATYRVTIVEGVSSQPAQARHWVEFVGAV
jgi:hypothetical protein